MSTRKRAAVALLVALAAFVAIYAANVAAGMRAAAQTSGELHVAGLQSPVVIVRDVRDVPHIRAQNLHDAMFAQGYVEASDRLFQMDLIRRFVRGRLSEVLGKAVLPADERARIVPIDQIVRAQWDALDPQDRAIAQAFSDGVNAAMQHQPLPPEFRLLLYKPEPWAAQDCLVVSFSTVLDLIDAWDDVIGRDAVARTPGLAPVEDLYSITDPAYDTPLVPRSVAPLPRLHDRFTHPAGKTALTVKDDERGGSNEWAAGAQRSSSGHALLANDPHLRVGIPGVWYLLELKTPGLHVAGGSLAGTPGIVLGHNENIAWGATNGTVVTEVVYRDPLVRAQTRNEVFRVRFAGTATHTYYTTAHGFAAKISGQTAYAVDWNAVRLPRSPLTAFRQLDTASSIPQALAALRTYPGPPQNFVIADRNGAVAYHLAGLVPNDPLWGLRVHKPSDPLYAFVPFDELPHVAPSRGAVVFTANNRMYGKGYPYRLSAGFAAPYRARRIAQMLAAHPHASVADFTAMQLDTLSLAELELARATLAALRRSHAMQSQALAPYPNLLASWNGRFDPDSRVASIVYELRRTAIRRLAGFAAGGASKAYEDSAGNAVFMLLMRVIRERPRGWWRNSDYDDLLVSSLRAAVANEKANVHAPWRETGAVLVKHPLNGLGLTFLDGGALAGNGDSYALRVLNPSPHAQSFRAVWDTGNWDAGGMSIPSGESGEPGSGHYTDLRAAWTAGKLAPLPFSDAAVKAAARSWLTLAPH